MHNNFDCLQFNYAEHLSLYVAKQQCVGRIKTGYCTTEFIICFPFKLEIFITASRPQSAVLCKNQSYKNRTFSTHFMRVSSRTIVSSICFNIHMDYYPA